MKYFHIEITDDKDRDVVNGQFTTLEAIAQLQSVIATLRAEAVPTFDASWGEQPMPVLGPSASELPHTF